MDIHTNAYVKLLLSPRQSRGITHFIYTHVLKVAAGGTASPLDSLAFGG